MVARAIPHIVHVTPHHSTPHTAPHTTPHAVPHSEPHVAPHTTPHPMLNPLHPLWIGRSMYHNASTQPSTTREATTQPVEVEDADHGTPWLWASLTIVAVLAIAVIARRVFR